MFREIWTWIILAVTCRDSFIQLLLISHTNSEWKILASFIQYRSSNLLYLKPFLQLLQAETCVGHVFNCFKPCETCYCISGKNTKKYFSVSHSLTYSPSLPLLLSFTYLQMFFWCKVTFGFLTLRSSWISHFALSTYTVYLKINRTFQIGTFLVAPS